MREVVSVAAALGYGDRIQEEDVEDQVQRSRARRWPGVEPSMLADIMSEKSMEVEAIIEEVVKVAKQN